MAELIRRDVEIFACLESEDYGGAADKVHCATIPFLNGYTVMTIYEPHGVPGSVEEIIASPIGFANDFE